MISEFVEPIPRSKCGPTEVHVAAFTAPTTSRPLEVAARGSRVDSQPGATPYGIAEGVDEQVGHPRARTTATATDDSTSVRLRNGGVAQEPG